MNVTRNTPSTFIVQAENDFVCVENSLLYYLGLRTAGAATKSEMHIYPEVRNGANDSTQLALSGHGYGLCTPGISNLTHGEICSWTQRAEQWFHRVGISEAAAADSSVFV